MKTSPRISLFASILTGCMLSSCVYDSNPVPEMPYTPNRPAPLPPKLQPGGYQTNAAQGGAWYPAAYPVPTPGVSSIQQTTYVPVAPTAVRPVVPVAPITPVVRPATPVHPVIKPAPVAPVRQVIAPKPVAPAPPSSRITQTFTPTPSPTPVATAPAPAVQPPVVSTVTPPTPESTTPSDPKLITNTGPIPVATRVEGDPIRVYNPLDPTKTIRIIDPKTGKVHPSGKVLKVKGTNFKFIVP